MDSYLKDDLVELICCLIKAEKDGSDEEVEFWKREIKKEKKLLEEERSRVA